MLAALRRVFAAAHISVRTFSSGDALLSAGDLGAAGVLVLDVKMPGMSGLELQRRLRQRGDRLPIVFLSGSGDIPIAVEAMRDGAADFVEKPFDNAQLVERVRNASRAGVSAGGQERDATRYAEHRATLTPREREVLDEMITGKTSKQIGRILGVSHRTIEIHRAHVMDKMAVATLANLVRMALLADPLR
jgi:FixJ family two-component response regulator